MTPQEKKREQRLLKRYGITLDEYSIMQKNGCMICGKQGVTRSLHVDHCHKTAQAKIHSAGSKGEWSAWSQYEFGGYYAAGKTKREAIRTVREFLKKASVRGVLCWRHNRGIELFNDNPELLRAAATYIERFKNA